MVFNVFMSILGPNKYTMDDMWRMVWQLKCSRIVMVSNLVEDGRVSTLACLFSLGIVRCMLTMLMMQTISSLVSV